MYAKRQMCRGQIYIFFERAAQVTVTLEVTVTAYKRGITYFALTNSRFDLTIRGKVVKLLLTCKHCLTDEMLQ